MSARHGFALMAGVISLVACGAPGLPPAGPAPGSVDVGYGTRESDDVTGAVTTMTEEQVEASRPLPIEQLLRGRVAGLQIIEGPGGVTYRIRGTNSILFDQPPLFVIDGVQIGSTNVQTALGGIAPEDIRQIDVLKDVASTAIFGSRGAGGVILITTRR